MAREFLKGPSSNAKDLFNLRNNYNDFAYRENDGLGSIAIKDLNFVERMNYGFIDNNNYSVVPDEQYIVSLGHNINAARDQRILDFVADAYSNMRLNFTVACQKGLIQQQGAPFGELKVLEAYKSPRQKYENYLSEIFKIFETYISNQNRISNITSYKDYVNHFFMFLHDYALGTPITMSRFQKSTRSTVLDTGLAFKYVDISVSRDEQKVNEIIDHPSFPYFENLCYNMGFSILHNRPNVLLFDIQSAAAKPYLSRYGLFDLDIIFNNRFNYTYMHDMNILFNNINRYYNDFVLLNPRTKIVFVKCRSTVSEFVERQSVTIDYREHTETQILSMYADIRNIEEGRPYSDDKVREITRKSIYFHKRFDNERAMSYISSEYKDQVWNKDYGYDDYIKKLRGQTLARSGRRTLGEGATASSAGVSTTGGSSGY